MADAETKDPAQIIQLVHEHGVAKFFCPVCGEQLIAPEEGPSGEYCDDVLFVVNGEGEIEAPDDDVAEMIETTFNQAEEQDAEPLELLAAKLEPNVVLFLFVQPGQGDEDSRELLMAIDLEGSGAAR